MKPCFLLFFLFGQVLVAQTLDSQIHSHNDYLQDKPFWNAYNSGAKSIEVDVFLRNDTLYVTHYEAEIVRGQTIDNLYLRPMCDIDKTQSDNTIALQLLIDIKSEAKPTLERLIEVLGDYEGLIENKNFSFVISGNRPPVEEYLDYPEYILFDYQSLSDIEDTAIWEKIALISLPFYNYSKWNGKTRLTGLEYRKIRAPIDKAHNHGKRFRFWATPDTSLAWETFSRMGIDFINTDIPSACSKFLESIKKERP